MQNSKLNFFQPNKQKQKPCSSLVLFDARSNNNNNNKSNNNNNKSNNNNNNINNNKSNVIESLFPEFSLQRLRLTSSRGSDRFHSSVFHLSRDLEIGYAWQVGPVEHQSMDRCQRCWFLFFFDDEDSSSISNNLSISPSFYKQAFHTKVFCTAFLCLQFGCVNFWQKEISAKASRKLLVKLTTGSRVFILANRLIFF